MSKQIPEQQYHDLWEEYYKLKNLCEMQSKELKEIHQRYNKKIDDIETHKTGIIYLYTTILIFMSSAAMSSFVTYLTYGFSLSSFFLAMAFTFLFALFLGIGFAIYKFFNAEHYLRPFTTKRIIRDSLIVIAIVLAFLALCWSYASR